MDDKAKRALEIVMGINPFNIRSRTDATLSTQMAFENVWSCHGAMAARYYLLPSVYYGKLMVLQ